MRPLRRNHEAPARARPSRHWDNPYRARSIQGANEAPGQIQPHLAAWLRAYPLDRYVIVPDNAQRLRRKVFEEFDLTHDVMRHTFISMHVAKFRSMGEAALQAGNSEAIIRKHYLDLKSPAEAEQFFGILPKHAPAETRQPANVVAPPEFAARGPKSAAA